MTRSERVLSAGQGAKGPRWYDLARVRLARLQLTMEERRWDLWLLVRRSRSNLTDVAYYVVFAPAATALRTLARVAGEQSCSSCLASARSATRRGRAHAHSSCLILTFMPAAFLRHS